MPLPPIPEPPAIANLQRELAALRERLAKVESERDALAIKLAETREFMDMSVSTASAALSRLEVAEPCAIAGEKVVDAFTAFTNALADLGLAVHAWQARKPS